MLFRAALRGASAAAAAAPCARRAVVGRAHRFASTVTGTPSTPKAAPTTAPTSEKVEVEVEVEVVEKKKKTTVAASSEAAPASATPNLAAQDKESDDLLNNALLEALKEIQLEAEPAAEPLTVTGYDEPVFAALPATNPRYPSPSSLPLPAPKSPSPADQPTSEEAYHATLIHGRSSLPPVHHTPPYTLPVAQLHFRSHSPKLLDFFVHFSLHAAASLGIPVSKPAKLPTQRSMWTVPKSPFVHKSSQENFERRTHKRCVKAWDADPEVVERWVGYLRRHAMGGVGVRVVRWERAALGVGRD
ncbi:ribosomal protein S10 domain-containing protein, partial [Ephemerocybe angulata]